MSKHIRIFPHSREEFPSLDDLITWLMTALRGKGGKYLLRSANSVADLPEGSIVLFRYAHLIVGEGVVKEPVQRGSHTEQTLTGTDVEYGASVIFSPSSIRIYAPPIPVDRLQEHVGTAVNIGVPRSYYKIENWSVYPKLLADVVTRGSLMSSSLV